MDGSRLGKQSTSDKGYKEYEVVEGHDLPFPDETRNVEEEQWCNGYQACIARIFTTEQRILSTYFRSSVTYFRPCARAKLRLKKHIPESHGNSEIIKKCNVRMPLIVYILRNMILKMSFVDLSGST